VPATDFGKGYAVTISAREMILSGIETSLIAQDSLLWAF
jgi:hypothetical protein